MKNILIILILSFFYINIGYTNEPCYKGGGFLTVEKKFVKKVTFKDPKNTLVFIHSHGGSNDKSKNGSGKWNRTTDLRLMSPAL